MNSHVIILVIICIAVGVEAQADGMTDDSGALADHRQPKYSRRELLRTRSPDLGDDLDQPGPSTNSEPLAFNLTVDESNTTTHYYSYWNFYIKNECSTGKTIYGKINFRLGQSVYSGYCIDKSAINVGQWCVKSFKITGGYTSSKYVSNNRYAYYTITSPFSRGWTTIDGSDCWYCGGSKTKTTRVASNYC